MIESIAPTTIAQIAGRLFGEATRVASVQKIAMTEEHGITKVAESTRNLLYRVQLEKHPHLLVFRFARTPSDDVYEQEVQNYKLLAEYADAPVPTVYGVDRSQQIAPTSYMVMEYLQGDDWRYLAHPDNPETTHHEKATIRRKVGRFYAHVHGITQETTPSHIEVQEVMYAMDRLEAATSRGVVDVDPATIERCRRAAMQEPIFQECPLSLCLIDTEILFTQEEDGTWEMASVCDAEWVGYRNRYVDLTTILTGKSAWWEKSRPLAEADPTQVAHRSFFQGYEAVWPVDYEALLHLSPYYELGRWAYLANEVSSPAKKQWIKAYKEPLIQELVRRIATRA